MRGCFDSASIVSRASRLYQGIFNSIRFGQEKWLALVLCEKGLLGFRQVVSCDFELIPVGVGKVNRVSDPVILELEWNASLLQVRLCFQQVGVRSAKCQVAHPRLRGAAGAGRRLGRTQRKQGNTSRAGAKHGGGISPRFPVT